MKLLSTTILASAAIAFAGAAFAGPYYAPSGGKILNDQLNLGNVEADLNVTSEVSSPNHPAIFTEFTLTSAAIGNSLSVDIKRAEHLRKIRNRQENLGDASASLTLGARGFAFSGGDEIDDLEATVAAIGNNMNVVVRGHHYAKIKNRQLNDAEYVNADAYISSVDTEDLTATVAAIGNSASIEADETAIKKVKSKQINYADATAVAAIYQDGDLYRDYTYPGDLEATVAAIGNSLSVETDNVTRYRLYGGDIRSVQRNKTRRVRADLELLAAEINVEATVAAIGNSFNAELHDRLSQDITVFQANRARVKATGYVDVIDNENMSIDATVAAIGNSANVTVEGDWMPHNAYGDVTITQLNRGRAAIADLELLSDGGPDSITATSAAIGNSAVVELSSDFFTNIDSRQRNKADATATMNATITDATDVTVDLTAAAIGNSLSINIGH